MSNFETFSLFRRLISLSLLFVLASNVFAAVLPEDRADVLYHINDGGGVEVSGPSVLVRKQIGKTFSASVNHYVDSVSSASIDVLTSASPYTEKRNENSFSLDHLSEKTLMGVSVTKSVESDFDASTIGVSFSQEFFGDLTTLNMGYSRGDNIISRNGDTSFSRQATTRNYRLSLSQVVSKDMIVAFAYENATDEGYLNNPYRSVRYLNATGSNFLFQSEIYPGTRTSNAFAIRTRYYLQRRAAIHGGYRYFNDTWGITANTFDLGYTFPYKSNWIFESNLRYYSQTKADFYNDLFPFQDAQNFLARDKELSTFTSITLGGGASYELDNSGWFFLKRGSLNLNLDYIQFDYDDFRNIPAGGAVGSEPLYSFSAVVLRAFASFWF
jgi:hypothetical protein